MKNSWDINAYNRHKQILSGKDISLIKILAPTIVKLVKQSGEKTPYVLEVGCGTGYITKILGEIADRVVGIDPSYKAILIAKEYLAESENVEVKCVSIEDHEVDPSTLYDVIVSNMTFQVIPTLELVIGKLSILLRDNGRLIFSIPHPFFWPRYKNLFSEGSFEYYRKSTHQIPFTISNDRTPLPSNIPYYHRPLEDYTSSLKSAGFHVLNIMEPFPGEDLMELYDEPWKNPHFMIFECQNCAYQGDSGEFK